MKKRKLKKLLKHYKKLYEANKPSISQLIGNTLNNRKEEVAASILGNNKLLLRLTQAARIEENHF